MNLPDWMRRPAIYLCRHGATELNADRAFRGWMDVPLTEEGKRSAEEMANFLSYEMLGPVACHDLQRGVQTAEIICQSFDRNPMLRPWNIGIFAGKPKAKYQAELKRHIENPDLPIKDGETLNDFRRRWETTLSEYMAQAATSENPLVLVTSNSAMVATAELYGFQADKMPEDAEIVEPGGIVALYLNSDGSVDMVPKLGAVIREPLPAS